MAETVLPGHNTTVPAPLNLRKRIDEDSKLMSRGLGLHLKEPYNHAILLVHFDVIPQFEDVLRLLENTGMKNICSTKLIEAKIKKIELDNPKSPLPSNDKVPGKHVFQKGLRKVCETSNVFKYLTIWPRKKTFQKSVGPDII